MTLRIERLEMPPFGANTYVVGDDVSKEAIIIDPGKDVDRIADVLKRHGYTAKAILATHGHIDHVAGAADAKARFAVPFMVHSADKVWIDSLDRQSKQFGFPHCETPHVDRWLASNDKIAIGTHEGQVVHTPGHSEGGCSVIFADDKIAFTGDTLFRSGVGRSDMPGGSSKILMSSIQSNLVPLGDDVAFHPGHGPSGNIGEERRRLGM
jgi:glyoxylase-like metal-dependent hydrolase (beta-lactamase superfamily II)